MSPYILGIIWAFIFLFMTLSFNMRYIKQWFNLVDKRRFIESEEVWQKYNRLAMDGEVDLTTLKLTDRQVYWLRVKYEVTNEETANGRFEGDNINEVITNAYNWAVGRNLIKE